jgi:hypothetical protein
MANGPSTAMDSDPPYAPSVCGRSILARSIITTTTAYTQAYFHLHETLFAHRGSQITATSN